jgi:hypothetical protein
MFRVQLMGDWYAVEIVEHNTATEANTISTVINACPILQLTRENNVTIRLQWNEDNHVWVYTFFQPRVKHPGFWETAGYQDGEAHLVLTSTWFTSMAYRGRGWGC